ncbi:hypothetical protein ACHQM5_028547 [Ranunculus cassubicifolius]
MENEMKSDNQSRDETHHVLVLPFPFQGHINPMLQFSKRLVSKGLTVTLAVTKFIAKSMPSQTGAIQIKTISDGFDEGGYKQAGRGEVYLDRFKIVGPQTLRELILKQNQESSKPFTCIIYDAFLPWALGVAKQFNLFGALFFTQSCAVNAIYYNVQQGLLPVPVAPGSIVSLPGLPQLEIAELPSFISTYGLHSTAFSLLNYNHFHNINEVDCILVVNWMSKLWPIKTIGPTLPSAYLDNRIEDDRDYDLNLFDPSRDVCIEWLNKIEKGTVVYVSFGSVAPVTSKQMEEVAWGLRDCNDYYFLWVIRESEMRKLPSKFIEETSEKGLVVNWCPQLEVLSHPALGCFVTHCGWNSTLEALSLGVPMVALPQLSDQPTNAKYVTDVIKIGNRARLDEHGVATRKEIEACIKQVMEKGEVLRGNANRWKTMAKEAVDEGGSSDNNIQEFINNLSIKHSL